MDVLSLQSMEGHLQTSMEVWVDNNIRVGMDKWKQRNMCYLNAIVMEKKKKMEMGGW